MDKGALSLEQNCVIPFLGSSLQIENAERMNATVILSVIILWYDVRYRFFTVGTFFVSRAVLQVSRPKTGRRTLTLMYTFPPCSFSSSQFLLLGSSDHHQIICFPCLPRLCQGSKYLECPRQQASSQAVQLFGRLHPCSSQQLC